MAELSLLKDATEIVKLAGKVNQSIMLAVTPIGSCTDMLDSSCKVVHDTPPLMLPTNLDQCKHERSQQFLHHLTGSKKQVLFTSGQTGTDVKYHHSTT